MSGSTTPSASPRAKVAWALPQYAAIDSFFTSFSENTSWNASPSLSCAATFGKRASSVSNSIWSPPS
eukprot:1620684-Pyramimonas_sp.AAC.1